MAVAVLSDAELLKRVVASRDPDAIRGIIERYQSLVYASALRQLRRADLAEDVTQAVFLVLATKASSLNGVTTLGGWLMKVTRYAAIDAMRQSNRQTRHEQAAARERPETAALSAASEEWSALSVELDAAMGRLAEMDRNLIVQRFFQDQPLAQIGQSYGVSEEAARKRVSRAVDRLRQMLQEKGVSMASVAIGSLLLQHAAPAVPETLSVALAGNASTASFSIAKGTIAMIGWTKAKLIGMIAAVTILGVGGGALVIQKWGTAEAETPPAQPPAASAVPATALPAAAPANDAVSIYKAAADKIVVDSPAASVLDYNLPFGIEWMRMAAISYERNKPARELMRQALTFNQADWPSGDPKYLTPLRSLANEVGDAALYAHSQKRDAEAIALLRDGMHLGSLLMGQQKADGLIRMLVGVGIDALVMERLHVISARIVISNDGAGQTVSAAEIRKLIATLLDQRSPDDRIKDAMTGEPGMQKMNLPEVAATEAILGASMDRAKLTVRRVNAERTLAAMSLACHLYQFEKNAWPAKLDDLIPAYLPAAPIDPFGDGKETFGYVLIQKGQPGGGDRPLVYCRSESPDGLFFRLDMPHYGFYSGDGRNVPVRDQKRGGQFRDLTWWEPRSIPANAPTTQPLPQ